MEDYVLDTMEKGTWAGWYLTRGAELVLRLTEPDYTVKDFVSVEYRFYDMTTGKLQFSGITLFGRECDLSELRQQMKILSYGYPLGHKMCGLEGMMADSLHEAYIGGSSTELNKVNRMIQNHFC